MFQISLKNRVEILTKINTIVYKQVAVYKTFNFLQSKFLFNLYLTIIMIVDIKKEMPKHNKLNQIDIKSAEVKNALNELNNKERSRKPIEVSENIGKKKFVFSF